MTEPEGPATPGTPATPENAFHASFFSEPNMCTDNSVRLMGHYSYDDNSIPDNVVCRYELSDGTLLADTCFATPSLPVGDVVTLTVTDPATGAVATHQSFTQGPQNFTTSVTASSDGLSISWDAHTMYGISTDAGGVLISISPSENVIAPDPMALSQFTGTVNVTEAGTYTVHVFAGISFAEVGGCGAEAETTVEVTCDDATHEH